MATVVRDIFHALKGRCASIKELGVIPGVTGDEPNVIEMEGNIGIAMSVLKPLYKFSIKEFYRLHGRDDMPASVPGIIVTDTRVSDNTAGAADQDMINQSVSASLDEYTVALLVVKGDFPMAYSARKKLIESGFLTIAEELPFTAVLFTRYAKIPSGWEHRRWCLHRNTLRRAQHIGDNMGTIAATAAATTATATFDNHQQQPITKSSAAALLRGEIETEKELCREMAEKHPKNYYAWVHRLWLLRFMDLDLLIEEMDFIKDWLHSHVSDHSACNHLIQVVLHCLQQMIGCYESQQHLLDAVYPTAQQPAPTATAAVVKLPIRIFSTNIALNRVYFLTALMCSSEQLLTQRPGHEALWCLRRSLLELLLKHTVLCWTNTEPFNLDWCRLQLPCYEATASSQCFETTTTATTKAIEQVITITDDVAKSTAERIWAVLCPSSLLLSTCGPTTTSSNSTEQSVEDIKNDALQISLTNSSADDLEPPLRLAVCASFSDWSESLASSVEGQVQHCNSNNRNFSSGNTNSSLKIAAQMLQLLRLELLLCGACFQNDIVWDAEQQRRLALRYALFAVDRTTRLFMKHSSSESRSSGGYLSSSILRVLEVGRKHLVQACRHLQISIPYF